MRKRAKSTETGRSGLQALVVTHISLTCRVKGWGWKWEKISREKEGKSRILISLRLQDLSSHLCVCAEAVSCTASLSFSLESFLSSFFILYLGSVWARSKPDHHQEDRKHASLEERDLLSFSLYFIQRTTDSKSFSSLFFLSQTRL